MSLSDVVNCTPWRLTAPRPLTPFEWGVVETALRRGMDEVQFGGLGGGNDARVLAMAMMAQQSCPAWNTSMFGPAPAVATYWYKCLGRWYATLAVQQRASVAGGIATGLLCSGQAPWGNCPPAGRGAAELWEGGPQQADPKTGVLPVSGCDFIRDRTVYTPVKGKELLKLVELVGPGIVPAGLANMATFAPQLFLERDFVLGIQAKKNVDPKVLLSSGQDVVGMALTMLEEAALMWAPGQGTSLLDFLKGPVDPAKLFALLGQMSPDLVGQLGGALAQQLPGILQQWGPQLGNVLQTAGQILPGLLGGGLKGFGALGASSSSSAKAQPGTRPVTGIRVLDKTGASLAGDPAPPLAGSGEGISKALWIGAAAVGFVALVLLIKD